ncbi:MAG: PQQ-dependent sugar dehydrogenase [Planctomycetota bacterium]
MSWKLFALALLCAIVQPLVVSAQIVPAGFLVEQLVTQGLASPTDLCVLDDGRVLMTEKASGNIQLWVPTLGDMVTTIGTVTDVDSSGERGLLSLTVDPDFATNGFLYVWTARADASTLALLRYELAGDLSDGVSPDLVLIADSETTLLVSQSENDPNHNGGTIRFGPDEMLYLSIGDDADPMSAQDSADLKGCVLRLDLSSVPAQPGLLSLADLDPGDNPFSDSGLVAERLTIAWGLRNPFSFSIDADKGDLFIADVGRNDREELNHWPYGTMGSPCVGLNYGWPHLEGTLPGIFPFQGVGSALNVFELPIDERLHFADGFVIISAGIYRNRGGLYDWGPTYDGALFHSDFLLGTIERLEFDAVSLSWVTAASVSGQPAVDSWASGFVGFCHFEMAKDGGLYGIDFFGDRLVRIRPTTLSVTLSGVLGADQVGVKGRAFKNKFVFELVDSTGLALVGETIHAQVSPNASFVGLDSAVTDAQGRVEFCLFADEGGPVVLTATTNLSSGNPAQISAFARALEVQHIALATTDVVIVELLNISFGPDLVPSLIVAAGPSAQGTTSVIGDLVFSPPNTTGVVVIEDPIGTLGGTIMQGGLGAPGLLNVYIQPAGLLQGTFEFQAIWLDFSTFTSIDGLASSPLGASNAVTVTF